MEREKDRECERDTRRRREMERKVSKRLESTDRQMASTVAFFFSFLLFPRLSFFAFVFLPYDVRDTTFRHQEGALSHRT